MRNGIYFLVFLIAAALAACKKDPPPKPAPAPPSVPADTTKASAAIVIKFRPVVMGQGALVKDSVHYDNSVGDRFTVSTFNYYISNIRLVTDKSVVYIEPESYHLIKHFLGKESFTIADVPPGNYVKMEFMIGVDSARNVSGAQTGDLDAGHQMSWPWNSGYIFYKLEGTYTALSTTQGEYGFHIGGFAGPNKTIENVALDIEGAETMRGHVTEVTVFADAGAVFDTPEPFGFDSYNQMFPSPKRDKIQSQNYRDMFSLAFIQILKK